MCQSHKICITHELIYHHQDAVIAIGMREALNKIQGDNLSCMVWSWKRMQKDGVPYVLGFSLLTRAAGRHKGTCVLFKAGPSKKLADPLIYDLKPRMASQCARM
uniref:Uncharacterized protein n=1 Tax=Arundo donax TaxID=35708 RepID=A0A0A9D5F5_ARUDO